MIVYMTGKSRMITCEVEKSSTLIIYYYYVYIIYASCGIVICFSLPWSSLSTCPRVHRKNAAGVPSRTRRDSCHGEYGVRPDDVTGALTYPEIPIEI